ncbi:MAG: sialidase family protein [Flavobacteriales bacterium]
MLRGSVMKAIKRAALLAVLLLAMGSTGAQSPYRNILITSQDNGWFGYPPCEPSIWVSRMDPARMVAGTILNGYHTSADSGRTWISGQLSSTLGVYGDPVITGNHRGDFYYCHLGDPDGQGWASDRLLECIVCQRSTDGGYSWSDGAPAGTNPPRDQDKQWTICSPDDKRVYMSWTQFDRYESRQPGDSSVILFSSAKARMKKWRRPVRISERAGNCLDDDGTTEGAVPACGPGKEVYVAWALNETIWFDRSLDGGRTWLERDIPAARIHGGWNQDIPGIMRANGMPVLVSDLSVGPRRGYLYLCWSDTRNGENNTDVFFAWSSDKGQSWSAPIRINDDAGVAHQFFPWMAVDASDGSLHVVFYDRRRKEGQMTDVFLASSQDGGKTWTNERISEAPFEPVNTVFFGDYNNISAHGGVVRPVWTRCENGKLSVWTALINR